MDTKKPLLRIQDLRAHFHTRRGIVKAVDGISFDVGESETVCLVGESGSGKTVSQLSYLRLLPEPPLKIVGGSVHFQDKNLLEFSPSQMRAVRGFGISMIFQEPMTSLNPYLTIGSQLAEPLQVHLKRSKKLALVEAQAALERTGIVDAHRALSLYPHEFSGGMRQRVMIAMALTTKPKLLIADEPTTALDVTVQAQILTLLKDIQKETGMSILFITHDLAVVASLAERVVVMNSGLIVEQGPVEAIFYRTQHPYTRALLKATPRMDGETKQAPGGPTAMKTVAKIQDLSVQYPVRGGFLGLVPKPPLRAVDQVSLELGEGEILGLVGESGCGKSSLGKAFMRLIEPAAGRIEIGGVDFTSLRGEKLRQQRAQIQMVFQDPYASLDPRMTVFQALCEPLLAHHRLENSELQARATQALERVGLTAKDLQRYPHEFSGGQRQRIAIARALILKPKILVADEPVSSLDVSVQAQILNLLLDIQEELKLSMVFISHNLAVVKYLADRIAVMYLGKIVELADQEDLFRSPQHPYTQALLAAVPIPDPQLERKRQCTPLQGEPPSAMRRPVGCPFQSRCPLVYDRCRNESPSLEVTSDSGHRVSCFAVGKAHHTL